MCVRRRENEQCIPRSPGRSRRPFVSRSAATAFTQDHPSAWSLSEQKKEEAGKCVHEVFITTGISLFPLIPSLGSPFLFIFSMQWLHLHGECRIEQLILLYTPCRLLHSRALHRNRTFKQHSPQCTCAPLLCESGKACRCHARGCGIVQSAFESLAWRMPPQTQNCFLCSWEALWQDTDPIILDLPYAGATWMENVANRVCCCSVGAYSKKWLFK